MGFSTVSKCFLNTVFFLFLALWNGGEFPKYFSLRSNYTPSLQLDWTCCADTQKINFLRDREGYNEFETLYKSSRWAASTGVVQKFIFPFLGSYFFKNGWNALFFHSRVGCALAKALIRRSRVFLECLGLVGNWFFRKPSCCVFARKPILIDLDLSRSEY